MLEFFNPPTTVPLIGIVAGEAITDFEVPLGGVCLLAIEFVDPGEFSLGGFGISVTRFHALRVEPIAFGRAESLDCKSFCSSDHATIYSELRRTPQLCHRTFDRVRREHACVELRIAVAEGTGTQP